MADATGIPTITITGPNPTDPARTVAAPITGKGIHVKIYSRIYFQYVHTARFLNWERYPKYPELADHREQLDQLEVPLRKVLSAAIKENSAHQTEPLQTLFNEIDQGMQPPEMAFPDGSIFFAIIKKQKETWNRLP